MQTVSREQLNLLNIFMYTYNVRRSNCPAQWDQTTYNIVQIKYINSIGNIRSHHPIHTRCRLQAASVPVCFGLCRSVMFTETQIFTVLVLPWRGSTATRIHTSLCRQMYICLWRINMVRERQAWGKSCLFALSLRFSHIYPLANRNAKIAMLATHWPRDGERAVLAFCLLKGAMRS